MEDQTLKLCKTIFNLSTQITSEIKIYLNFSHLKDLKILTTNLEELGDLIGRFSTN